MDRIRIRHTGDNRTAVKVTGRDCDGPIAVCQFKLINALLSESEKGDEMAERIFYKNAERL